MEIKTSGQGLINAALDFGPHVDALMLGYGLCGNALEIAKRLFKRYERSLLISTPIMPLEEMKKKFGTL